MAKRVSDLQFSKSRHRYTHPYTGERYPGVTSIANCYDDGDKLGAGAGAGAALQKQGIDYRQDWNAKKVLGTRVHSYAHLWVQGKTAEVLDEDEGHMDAFAKFCREKEPQWIQTERAVVSDLGYGGALDAIGEFDGLWVLCDFKTGRHWAVPLTLQLAAYRYAEGMILYDEEGQSKALEPMPHIDACAGLYLAADGTYNLAYVDANEEAFENFKRLMEVKKWATAVGKA